jgi:hypothetical protein
MEHQFTLLGFIERWARTAPSGLVFMVVGLILMALDVPGKHESVNLVGLAMAAIGCVVLLYVVARFLTIRRVEVGPEGLRWSGIFGSTYRTYREISSFYRTETITNRRFVTRYVKLKFTGGGSVTLDQSLTHYSVLAESLQRIAAETLLHEKRAEWDKLGAAHFGPVTIRADGIRVNGKFITRSAISRCQIENGHLVVYGDARRRSGRERAVPLSDVPNYAVLLELLAEKAFPYVGASPHGVSC